MSGWNYRITRETFPDGEHMFAIREVYYDDDGKPNGWTKEPIAAVGDTAIEVLDTLGRMSGCGAAGVLDLDTRETLTLRGKPKKSKKAKP